MFKPGDKVKRISHSHFRYERRTPLDVIVGNIYTVKECIGHSNITLVGYGSFTYSQDNFELVKEEEMSECTCNKKTPHVHAELIKAWADGATIQYFNRKTQDWRDIINQPPVWGAKDSYRIKPESKPDVVKYTYLPNPRCVGEYEPTNSFYSSSNNLPYNLKLTFDGETGKLKSVEIIA